MDVDDVVSDLSCSPAGPVNEEVEPDEGPDGVGVDEVASDFSVSPPSPVNEVVEDVEPLRVDVGGDPVYADDEVDSVSDMLMEIPRIDYNRA